MAKKRPVSRDRLPEGEFRKGLPRLLFETFHAVRDHMGERLAERGYPGLQLVHSRVLQHVVFTGGSLSHIAKASKMSRQAVSKAAGDLQDMGFLVLSPDPEDSRARIAELTEPGLELFKVLRSLIDLVETELADSIGEARLRTLRKTLQQIQAHVSG